MNFLEFDESLKILLNSCESYENYEETLLQNAMDRILASDIFAPFDNPKFKTASMDGYALKSENLSQKTTFKIISQTKAGDENMIKVNDFECVKTFTGAVICENCDTLVPIENVEVNGNFLEVKSPVYAGFAIRDVGEFYKKNEILLKKGEKLDFAKIGLLATLGLKKISVFKKLKVSILPTGNEIVKLGNKLKNNSQIYSSNGLILANLCKKFGCEAKILKIVKDDINLIENSIKNEIQDCDILVTTGGVSVGDFDFVKKILNSVAEVLISGVLIKPGRHIKIAKIGKKYIFSLPGFPNSAATTFILYFRPLINKILQQKDDFYLQAKILQNYEKKSNLTEFIPCEITFKNGEIFADISQKKVGSSAIISNLSGNLGFIKVEKNCTKFDLVNVIKV